MKMSVHSRNFPLCSQNDEPHCADDRNNNVKNGRNSNKTIKQSIELAEENNHQIDLQLCGRTDDDEVKFQCKNSEQFKMENYAHDIRSSNDSHSNDSIDAIKISSAINFSVDSILSGMNVTQTYNKDTSNALPKSTTADEFSRIHRPMPMRYMSNSNIFQGNQDSS